jgi:hypothetical protein
MSIIFNVLLGLFSKVNGPSIKNVKYNKMKKVFLGSIVLVFFAVAICLFQISCTKEAVAQTNNTYVLPPATTTTLGGVIVGNGLSITPTGVLSVNSSGAGLVLQNKILFTKESNSTLAAEIWSANYDGTGASKINIALPSGIVFGADINPRLSPNGLKIFFAAGPANTTGVRSSRQDLYSCNANGSGVALVASRGAFDYIQIGGAY